MAEDTGKNKRQIRIGILTFWWSNDNYGQLLQCYALQKYLRDAGYDAFLIRYDFRNDFVKTPFILRCVKALNPVLLCRFLRHKINSRKVFEESKLNDRHFDDFRSKYIVQSENVYTSYNQLKENPPEADVYIVGSDQVWNISEETSSIYINSYFLNFGKEKVRRIAYAASWGSTSENLKLNSVSELLSKFELITCREETGLTICEKNGVSSKLVCDPTLLLSVFEWKKLFVPIIHRNYIFVYMLHNSCHFSYSKLKAWANLHNLSIIYVTGNCGYCNVDFHDKKAKLYYPSICEWLGLIFSAEYIVTNSFHCSLFSLLFRKKIATIMLSGRLKQSNSRILNLFSSLNCENIEIKNNDFDTLLSCKEQVIKKDFIYKSKEILINALNFGDKGF